MKDSIKIKGQVKLECYKDGVLKWSTPFMQNSIMNVGFAELANLAGNVSSPSAFTYLAVGTSNTAIAVTQTALGGEITDTGLARASATVSRVTTNVTNDTLQLVHTWTATGTKAIEEIGVFNASSAGVMLARKLTGTKTVANGEQIQATYQIIFA